MNYWAKMARTHWKQYLPEMYLKYQEQGILEQELTNAGEKAAEMMGELVESGLRRNEVLEIVLPQFILLTPGTQPTDHYRAGIIHNTENKAL